MPEGGRRNQKGPAAHSPVRKKRKPSSKSVHETLKKKRFWNTVVMFDADLDDGDFSYYSSRFTTHWRDRHRRAAFFILILSSYFLLLLLLLRFRFRSLFGWKSGVATELLLLFFSRRRRASLVAWQFENRKMISTKMQIFGNKVKRRKKVLLHPIPLSSQYFKSNSELCTL